MRRIQVGALALLVGAMIAAGPLAGGASAGITGTPGHGCPYGAVCVYPTGTTFNTGPETTNGIFYSYGAHNLHSQYGYHLVYNNQYNERGLVAGLTFCRAYNGWGGMVSGAVMNHRGWWAPVYLTPVNSITLWLYYDPALFRFVNCGW